MIPQEPEPSGCLGIGSTAAWNRTFCFRLNQLVVKRYIKVISEYTPA